MLESIKKSIKKIKIIENPFPHFCVENFLEDNLYNKLINHIPEDRFFKASSSTRTSNPKALKYRRRINLNEETYYDWNPEIEQFLKNFSKILLSKEFSLLIQEKFSKYLLKRYKQPKLNSLTRLELVRDIEGYEIKPHTDAPYKFITLLFYIPKDSKNPDLGTSLFIPNDVNFTDERGVQKPFELFHEVKRFPYLPNTLCGFLKNDKSFHGRFEVKNIHNQYRDWINISIQLPKVNLTKSTY